MNLLEAIHNCGDNWFRPVLMKNTGAAYSFDDLNGVLTKHQPWGGSTSLVCLPKVYLTGEWEIVTPEQVMKERN